MADELQSLAARLRQWARALPQGASDFEAAARQLETRDTDYVQRLLVQRDAAWRECDQLRVELEELKRRSS